MRIITTFNYCTFLQYYLLDYFLGEAAKNVEIYDNLDEEVDDFVVKPENQLSIDENHLNLNGKPFSAVHPAIRIKYYDEAPEK